MTEPTDYLKVMGILRQNESKNFVQRILHPEKFPVINMGNGNIATHLMSWGEMNGKYYVYPSIQYDPETKTLINWGADLGFDKARQSGEMIEFDNPQDADWFSKNYKLLWSNFKNEK